MSLGALVRSARMRAEYSQSDLARQMFLKGYTFDPSVISLIETGKIALPSKEILHGLADVLDITVIEMLHAAGYIPDDEVPQMMNGEMARLWHDLPPREQGMMIEIAKLYLSAIRGELPGQVPRR